MNLKIPQSLRTDHEELHAELEKAKKSGGATGGAARGVDCALQPHFEREEEYALPPLGLLPTLASGNVSQDMMAAVEMTGRLRSSLGQMLQEHKEIAVALGVLTDAAKQEGKDDAVRFAEKLMLHARMEEEVLYPASILIGEYLKLKGK
ncbi:MAG: hemerythrin domain-containing protein [Methanotrichaceae archaeon]|nr:hemerythrin domain-containing protein [Methanotrichaceae archaeon]